MKYQNMTNKSNFQDYCLLECDIMLSGSQLPALLETLITSIYTFGMEAAGSYQNIHHMTLLHLPYIRQIQDRQYTYTVTLWHVLVTISL